MDMYAPIKRLVIDAARTSGQLFRIMVPLLVLVKVLQELGLIEYLAVPLSPLMVLAGLPAETGLVWAAAIANGLYSAIVVYISLLPQMPPLTVAQITVLAVMMLIAHALPVEVRIAQKCGVSFWGQLGLRLVGAYVCGVLLALFFNGFDLLQEPSRIVWQAEARDESLLGWTVHQVRNLGAIFLIILSLMALMRILNKLRITELLTRLLQPFLRLVGIGREAAAITIIGLTMGIGYGGGLIIHEVGKGNIGKRDVFAAVSLMGLTHSLIEDSILMMMIGASAHGVYGGRLVFSIIVVAVMTRWIARRSRRREAES